MAYNVQLESSIYFKKSEEADEKPSTINVQNSPYSFLQKISGVTNPVTLRHDILYPSALAAVGFNRSQSNESGQIQGCKGHQIDVEFPLEPRTPFVVPWVMYPTSKSYDGSQLHEVDLCAKPVLNWEGYIHDLRSTVITGRTTSRVIPDENSEDESTDPSSRKPKILYLPSKVKNTLIENQNYERQEPGEEYLEERKARFSKKLPKNASSENKKTLPDGCIEIPKLKLKERSATAPNKSTMHYQSYRKLVNIPPLKVKGTWNHLFGGYNGACCFVSQKASKRNLLFTGKGSQLRSIELKVPKKTGPSSIFSYYTKSIWEESPRPVPYNTFAKDKGPLNDNIFQIVSNERNDLLGVRRGKSVQIYSIDEETPYILENIPNVYYGTENPCPTFYQRKKIIPDPLLAGVTFNPKYSPEIVTVDENGVIRICDICENETVKMYMLPRDYRKQQSTSKAPEGYPVLSLNEATGIMHTKLAHLFLGWRDSLVSLCDRRDSSDCLSTLMDLKHDPYLIALSDQNIFHKNIPVYLNEYISCVRASLHDETYYYVGTTSKVYLMDLRVPKRPIFRVSHGLQSPMVYMDSVTDENYEVIIGGSQRLSESFCMITDRSHTNCIGRMGCTGESPVLYSYPRHLSNPREFYDAAMKEGFDLPFPSDHDMIKSHFHAWPTGLAMIPPACNLQDKFNLPSGFLLATSNNFGDVFLQQWDQKPFFRKMEPTDRKLRDFMTNWKKSMTPPAPTLNSSQKPPPSKNPFHPVDVSLIVEQLGKEITLLTRVRSTPFDCFRPKMLQLNDNMRTMVPMKDILHRLSGYKNDKVKGMISVWSEGRKKERRESVDAVDTVQLVEIKLEPEEVEGSLTSSLHTINLDASEQGEPSLPGENYEEFLENSQQYPLPESAESPAPTEFVPEDLNEIHDMEEEDDGERQFSFQAPKQDNSTDVFAFLNEEYGEPEPGPSNHLDEDNFLFENSQVLLSSLPSTSHEHSFGFESLSQSKSKRGRKSKKTGFL